MYRPVDKRENYVKRCVGMPGDSLHIINNQVYLNGQALADARNVQYNYYVETNGTFISDDVFRRLKVSKEDQLLVSFDSRETNYYYSQLPYLGFQPNQNGTYNPVYNIPLTKEALEIIRKSPNIVNIVIDRELFKGDTYPVDYDTGWSRDNYGPIWIPKKGATITLDEFNLAIYHRCIRNYENNTLEVLPGGSVLINGRSATTYTFKYDYYWMMGDNRHKSADSRSWGFVPEDHVVGKPVMVWLSLDKDRGLFDGKIRWNRIFRFVNSFDK
jgi:signal peptidase I